MPLSSITLMWSQFWQSFLASWVLIGLAAAALFTTLAFLVWWLDELDFDESISAWPELTLVGVKGGEVARHVLPKADVWSEIELEDLHH